MAQPRVSVVTGTTGLTMVLRTGTVTTRRLTPTSTIALAYLIEEPNHVCKHDGDPYLLVKIVVAAVAGKLDKRPNVTENYKKDIWLMKTYSVDRKLFDEDVIRSAIIKVCKNKKRYHGKKTKKYRFAQHILNNLDEYVNTMKIIIEDTDDLYKEYMLTGVLNYSTHPQAFKPRITDTFFKKCDNGKIREIQITPVWPDQVIHQLIINVGKEGFRTGMVRFSYGSIPGRGVHMGIRRIRKFIKLNRNSAKIKYAVKYDIVKCFKFIPHKELKDSIRKKFRGYLFVFICFMIVDAYESAKGVGLPIGWVTSPWFCNFLLTPIDHYMVEELKLYCPSRYIDDVVFFGANKRLLHKALASLSCLLNNINLYIKQDWQVFRFDYIRNDDKRCGRALDILGCKFYRDKTVLRKRNAFSIGRSARKLSKAKYITAQSARSFISKVGALKHCDSREFWKTFVKPFINMSLLKEVIRNEDRKYNTSVAVSY